MNNNEDQKKNNSGGQRYRVRGPVYHKKSYPRADEVHEEIPETVDHSAPAEKNIAVPSETHKGTYTPKTSGKFDLFLSHKYKPYLLIFLYSFILYAQTLKFDIVGFDDDRMIKTNKAKISDIKNLSTAFRTDSFFEDRGTYYRPLYNAALVIDAQFQNGMFNIFHFTNILYHCLVSCLIFYLFMQLGIGRHLSFLSSVIYASHPLAVFSVAWTPARNDTMLAAFFLLSFIFLIKLYSTRKNIFIAGHIIAFMLALLSKEAGIVFPVIFAFYLVFILKKRTVEGRDILLAALWVICIVIFWQMRSVVVQGGNDLKNPVDNILYNIPIYSELLRNFIVPVGLGPFPLYNSVSTAIGTVLLIGCIVAVYRVYTKNRANAESNPMSIITILGLFLFLIVIMPGTLIKRTNVSFYDYFQNRAYLPVIGILLAMSALLQKPFFGTKSRTISRIGYIIAAIFTVQTLMMSSYFKDPLSFYEFATSASSNSAVAWYNKATILGNATYKKFDEALICHDKAISINPEYWEAWYNKAKVLDEDLKKYPDAVKCYDKAIQFAKGADKAKSWYNKGIIYSRYKLNANELECYDSAIVYRPDHFGTWNNRGFALKDLGRIAEAEECFKRAKEIKSKSKK